MKLAMWLLRAFDVPSRNDALIGDLAEERAAGRSLVWLWGQTLAAIANTAARDVRDHWVLAFRAIVTGWAASFFIGWILEHIANLFFRPAFIFSGMLLYPNYMLYALLLLIWPMALGWIVAETHRDKRAAMVLAFAASVALYSPWRCIQCVPDGFDTSFLLACSGVLSILIGGFLPRLRKSLLEGAKA